MDVLKISIILSVVGLLALALVSFYLEPPQVQISSITPTSMGRSVKIVGELVEDNEYPNVRILVISDGSEIIVPLFFEVQDKIKRGDTLSVCGKVQLYKEKLEVVPSSPRDIKIIH